MRPAFLRNHRGCGSLEEERPSRPSWPLAGSEPPSSESEKIIGCNYSLSAHDSRWDFESFSWKCFLSEGGETPSGPCTAELEPELIPGPSGSPGKVQEELICWIIVSPSSSRQVSRVSAMRQTAVSLALKLKHQQRRWKEDGLTSRQTL